MGEYAEIYTENLALCWFKNYLKSDLVSLFFSEKDLIVTENYYLDSKYLYQGVISEKDTVKSRLIDLKRSIEAGETEYKLEEWKRMQLLLENIVYAFAN